MAPTKREQVLIERYKKSGGRIDQEKLDAPFGFLVRPLATVGLDSGKFALWFEEETSAAIKEAKLTFPIRRLMISPHIIDQTLSGRPSDGVVFKRNENAVLVAITLDHPTWQDSSDSSKLNLMYETIKQSILEVPSKHMDDNGRKALLRIVDNAYAKLQSRLVH